MSIGSIEGGSFPSTRLWREAVTQLTIEVDRAATGIASPLSVNVIFQVPGHILHPDFEGVRTGYYSRKQRALIVQAALPVDPPDDIDAYLKDVLSAAIREAEQWAKRRRVAPSLDALAELVSLLAGKRQPGERPE